MGDSVVNDDTLGMIVAIHPIAGRFDGAILSKKRWEVAKSIFGLLNTMHGNPAGWRWEFVVIDGTVIDTASPGPCERRIPLGYYRSASGPLGDPGLSFRIRAAPWSI